MSSASPPAAPPADAVRFITEHLPLVPVPGVPELVMHTAVPASGLGRYLAAAGNRRSPYWAYPWAGGIVLARYLVDHPETVAGRTVVDLGAGAGLVAIAAMKAGATAATAVEVDPDGVAAIALNAQANHVALDIVCADATSAPLPTGALILAGDVFYLPAVARKMLPFLRRCRAAGHEALIGDPFRAPLPQDRLRLLWEDNVPDFGSGGRPVRAGVFSLPD